MSSNSFLCCKDCVDRKIGCHSYCERYLKRKSEYDEYVRKVKKGRYSEKEILEYRKNLFGAREL